LSFREVLGEDKVVSRDRKTIGSELDVYVPDMKLAIEYGAWFYHKKRITNDLKKAKLCEEKGIRLIRIYDACGEDIVTGKDVLAYSHNIALDINDSIRVVNQIFLMINTGQTIDDERFYAISDKAYILSRRMTTDQFKEKMTAIQPNIEILGVYKSNSSRIPCKCKLCGHKWSPTAHGLLAGYGCPECYHKAQTKTEETYLRELSEINPDIELLESYVASNRRILVRCKKCGHQWKPYASTLLHGYGCVVCRKKAMEHKALTNIMEINPDIEVIGIYQGMGKSIKVRCKKCGNIWSPIVNNLIRNASHCPECSRKSVNRKLRMSTDDFVRRLSEVSPTIEVIGPFNGANNRVNVHCKTCGYEWSPIAMNLLTGRGCRKCKYREQAKRQRRTPEQFAQEMSIINPNIIVFGKYTKACERVEVQCKRCGKKWSPVASSLLAGTGCPSCSKKKNL
jgi:predicted  nucleic acid-binding Zn-ribbon protein